MRPLLRGHRLKLAQTCASYMFEFWNLKISLGVFQRIFKPIRVMDTPMEIFNVQSYSNGFEDSLKHPQRSLQTSNFKPRTCTSLRKQDKLLDTHPMLAGDWMNRARHYWPDNWRHIPHSASSNLNWIWVWGYTNNTDINRGTGRLFSGITAWIWTGFELYLNGGGIYQ